MAYGGIGAGRRGIAVEYATQPTAPAFSVQHVERHLRPCGAQPARRPPHAGAVGQLAAALAGARRRTGDSAAKRIGLPGEISCAPEGPLRGSPGRRTEYRTIDIGLPGANLRASTSRRECDQAWHCLTYRSWACAHLRVARKRDLAAAGDR